MASVLGAIWIPLTDRVYLSTILKGKKYFNFKQRIYKVNNADMSNSERSEIRFPNTVLNVLIRVKYSKWHFSFLSYTSYVALDDGNSPIISINNYKRHSVQQKRQDLPHTSSPILDSQYYQLYQCGTDGLLQWWWHMDQIYLYPEHQSPSSSVALLQQHVHVTHPNKQQ